MPYNPLNFVPSLISSYFTSDIFNFYFVYILALAFVATVPIVIRSIISLFHRG